MEIGKRSVIQTVEYYSVHEPSKVWALRLRDEQDTSKGFEEITFGALGRAINRAALWLQKSLDSSSNVIDIFAYQGPNDLRIPILCLAAAKLAKQVLLPSRTNSRQAQHYLLKATKCAAFIHANSMALNVDVSELHLLDLVGPELDDWLNPALVEPVSFGKTWEQHRSEPWIILHTSGTTGLPKILPYTHQMMTSFDAARMAAETEGENGSVVFAAGNNFTSIPMFHFVGLVVVLQFSILMGSVAVVGPSSTPPISAELLEEIIDRASVYGVLLPPADIEKLAATPSGWQHILKLKHVSYIGAQLRKSLGDKIHQHGVLVTSGIGTTEQGGYLQKLRRDSEWEYMTFSPSIGADFERYPGDEGLYELVFKKTPGLERHQQIFTLFPDRTSYPTNDLFYKHPSIEDTWKYAGRGDDYVKFSTGFGMLASRAESIIVDKSNGLVDAVLLAGTGHPSPCVILSPSQNSLTRANEDVEAFIEEVWPAIEAANSASGSMGQIQKSLVIVTNPTRPFAKTGKGTISRRNTLALYQDDIDRLYENSK